MGGLPGGLYPDRYPLNTQIPGPTLNVPYTETGLCGFSFLSSQKYLPACPVSLARGLHVLSMGSEADLWEQCLFSRSSFDVGQPLFIPTLQSMEYPYISCLRLQLLDHWQLYRETGQYQHTREKFSREAISVWGTGVSNNNLVRNYM